MTDFTEALRQGTLLLDGAGGVEFIRMNLSEDEFRGRRFITHPQRLKSNFDILCLTRPDLVRRIHKSYLDAGADIIETNTFNANALSQRAYGTETYVREINRCGARIAAAAAAGYTDRRRFTAGAMGPTAFSVSLPHDTPGRVLKPVPFDILAETYCEQALGLIEGGVDFLLIESIFDLQNALAAATGARRAMAALSKNLPLVFSFTVADDTG